MAIDVHPTAIVDSNAVLEDEVKVGPYCVIGDGAFIGARTKLLNHVTIMGNVRIGCDNVLYPYSVIGGDPQDRSYKGSPTWVVVGDRNIIREHVTMHRATEKELGITRVGSDNFFMVGSHVAHDCIIGNNVSLANGVGLSGHVHIHDFAIVSGLAGVHQFTTIGRYAFVGAMAKIVTDVPPYMLADGTPCEVRCVNLVGLKRRGFTQADIQNLAVAHRLLYRHKIGVEEARNQLINDGRMVDSVVNLFAFVDQQCQGHFGRGRERRKAA